MSRSRLAGVLHYVRSLVGLPDANDLDDAALLHRFNVQRDEAALVSLIQRHGPLVLAVCRQVLPDPHAAEDAFQATFLVLARKAGTIRRQEALGPWLHRVAQRAALKVRIAAARRRSHETEATAMRPDSVEDSMPAELRPAVHEEVDRLPEKYRVPVVLCYLQGQTNEAAARQLGWPVGSVKGRLTRARALLRRRLSRRGVTLSSAALAVLAAESAEAAVPADLVRAACGVVLRQLAGASEGTVTEAAALVEETFRTTASRLSHRLVFLLGGVFLGAGTVAMTLFRADEARPEAAPVAGLAAEADEPLPRNCLARLGSDRWRHSSAIHFVAFAAQGKELIAAGRDGSVRTWDAATGKEVRHFGAATGEVRAEAARVIGGEAALRYAYASPARVVALTADGALLATAERGGKSVRLWDVASGRETRTVAVAGEGVSNLTFTPDGKGLIVEAVDGALVLHAAATGAELRRLAEPFADRQQTIAGGVVVSPDGTTVAAILESTNVDEPFSKVVLRDLANGQARHTLRVSRFGATALAFTPDGRRLACPSFYGDVQFFEVATGKEVRALGRTDQRRPATGLAFAADGKTLVVRNAAGIVEVWDVEDARERRRIGEPADGALGFLQAAYVGSRFGIRSNELALSPDGKTLALGGDFPTVRLWDLDSGKELRPTDGHPGSLLTAHVSADNLVVLTRGSENSVRRWNALTGKETSRFALPAGTTAAAFAPDGRTMAVINVETLGVRLLDTLTGKELRRLEEPAGEPDLQLIDGLAFSRDGKRLAGHSQMRTVHVWDVSTGKVLHSVGDRVSTVSSFVLSDAPSAAVARVAFAPDGRTVASVERPTATERGMAQDAGRPEPTALLRLWDVAGNRALVRMELTKSVTDLSFTPDSRCVVVATADATVTAWEAASGQPRCRFAGSGAVALSADGRLLATGGEGGSVRLWDFRTGAALGRFTGHQGAVRTLAFAAEGRKLISGSNDTTVLIWNVPARPVDLPAEKRSPAQLEDAWKSLTADAASAHAGQCSLANAPAQSIAWLDAHVLPAEKPEVEQLARWLTELDSEKLDVRRQAEEALERQGEVAEPFLRAALDDQPSLQRRQRVQRLLDRLAERRQAPSVDVLRCVRAVEVLERIGSPEGREVLKKWASGAAGARLTCEAREALKRLDQPPEK